MLRNDAVALNGSRCAHTMRASGNTPRSASMWTAWDGILSDHTPGALDWRTCRSERSYSYALVMSVTSSQSAYAEVGMYASHRKHLKSWFCTNVHSVGPSASSQCGMGNRAAWSAVANWSSSAFLARHRRSLRSVSEVAGGTESPASQLSRDRRRGSWSRR
jgi:hypothetical protein